MYMYESETKIRFHRIVQSSDGKNKSHQSLTAQEKKRLKKKQKRKEKRAKLVAIKEENLETTIRPFSDPSTSEPIPEQRHDSGRVFLLLVCPLLFTIGSFALYFGQIPSGDCFVRKHG